MQLTKDQLASLGIRRNESMKKHTSFKVGGPADLFARPDSLDHLEKILCLAAKHELPITLMGSGTNLLVKDRGIRGLVISMTALKYPTVITPLEKDKYRVRVSAGTILAGLYRETMNHGICGMEFAAGIPGTVGGAVMMNAGTNEGTMSDVVESIDFMLPLRGIVTLPASALHFSHRNLAFNIDFHKRHQPVLVGVTLIMTPNDKIQIQTRWGNLLQKRKKNQPAHGASAGCFFKNPPRGESAGALIDQAGLKGFRVGDAMVSEKHANFILNTGQATARDILTLKQIIEEKVHNRFGILLENEVKIEGE
ncbi:UDP-N-acetylmuramate dehydrogenase [Desulfocicer niacini]